ncbi:MAG: glycosyltransferase family 2 protein [Acidaminococcus sp.]|jgi:glycosyltransferase involved in cell wall biosynthesis|nr:glycosyltransferase family 2 protein [Acidaminococcus sp.]MCI2116458.1 glycosyltransferase family 2 protein [Acidaminococcus sp.]
MKKVSVIIPCFNDGLYIDDAVNSALKQTYPNIEVVICDDGSFDKLTLQKLEEYEKKGITVIYKKNEGPSAARNVAIKASKGEYILPLDADDKIDSSYVAKAVKILDEDPHVGIVYCQAFLFGENKGKWDLPKYSMGKMLVNNVIFVSGLFRKSDWSTVGGYCLDLKYGIEDYDFWLSILGLGRRVVQLPEFLFYYRIKKESRNKKFDQDPKIKLWTCNKIYARHKQLYLDNLDDFYFEIRSELIKQENKINSILGIFGIKNKISKVPWLKKLIKSFFKLK